MNASLRRLVVALLVLSALVAVGSTGFWVLGHGLWTYDDCVYMTVITLSTVGFGELSRMGDVPGARALTVMLIVGGVGTLAYVQANVTAVLVEGVIPRATDEHQTEQQHGRDGQALDRFVGHSVPLSS